MYLKTHVLGETRAKQELLEGEERTASELRAQLARERARFTELALTAGVDCEPNSASAPEPWNDKAASTVLPIQRKGSWMDVWFWKAT